jgi:hypothetical protein
MDNTQKRNYWRSAITFHLVNNIFGNHLFPVDIQAAWSDSAWKEHILRCFTCAADSVYRNRLNNPLSVDDKKQVYADMREMADLISQNRPGLDRV